MNDLAVIQRKIYEIRGQRVILDRDLAALYGVETRVLNQAVRRNMDRFPEDFMFQLTLEEWQTMSSQIVTTEGADKQTDSILKSQIVISSWGGTRKLPFAFTEHGVVMLASLLRSDIAVTMSIQITRAFVAMRQTIATLASTEMKIELLTRDVVALVHARSTPSPIRKQACTSRALHMCLTCSKTSKYNTNNVKPRGHSPHKIPLAA